jgi:membrane protein involved in colicin uptake
MLLTPEESAAIQVELESRKAEIIDYQTQLSIAVPNSVPHKNLVGALTYSKKQVELLQKQLTDSARALEQDARNEAQEAKKQDAMRIERERQDAMLVERKRREAEAKEEVRKAEVRRREAERLQTEQKQRSAEAALRQAEAGRREATKKAAEELAEKTERERRYTLTAAPGESKKYALRVDAGGEMFDILIECKPVAK